MRSSAVRALQKGGIAVIPTDTLYGIVAQASDRKAVARLYALRRESARKPFIVLIGSLADLRYFRVKLSAKQRELLKKVWPGKVSVILDCPSKSQEYLHLGTKTLAFRLPQKRSLLKLLSATGPLVAPSANLEGRPPAQTISEAKRYLKDSVDAYVSAGRRLSGRPSTLVSLSNGAFKVIRQGAGALKRMDILEI